MKLVFHASYVHLKNVAWFEFFIGGVFHLGVRYKLYRLCHEGGQGAVLLAILHDDIFMWRTGRSGGKCVDSSGLARVRSHRCYLESGGLRVGEQHSTRKPSCARSSLDQRRAEEGRINEISSFIMQGLLRILARLFHDQDFDQIKNKLSHYVHINTHRNSMQKTPGP